MAAYLAPGFSKSEYYDEVNLKLRNGADEDTKREFEEFFNSDIWEEYRKEKAPELSDPYYTWDGRFIERPHGDGGEGKHTGVGVVVVKDGKILCATRHNDSGYGKLCGPGGHIDPVPGGGVEDPETAAIRETQEEFGITPKNLFSIGFGAEEEDGNRPYLFLCTEFEGTPMCEDLELVHPQWLTIQELEETDDDLLFAPFICGVRRLESVLGYRSDASDEEWITINGTHVLLGEGGVVSGGGKLNGMKFENARSNREKANVVQSEAEKQRISAAKEKRDRFKSLLTRTNLQGTYDLSEEQLATYMGQKIATLPINTPKHINALKKRLSMLESKPFFKEEAEEMRERIKELESQPKVSSEEAQEFVNDPYGFVASLLPDRNTDEYIASRKRIDDLGAEIERVCHTRSSGSTVISAEDAKSISEAIEKKSAEIKKILPNVEACKTYSDLSDFLFASGFSGVVLSEGFDGEKMLEGRYPRYDFFGMEMECGREAITALKSAADKFPFAKDCLSEIGNTSELYHDYSNCYACADNTRGLFFNKKFFERKYHLDATYDSSVRCGHFAKGTKSNAVFQHEISHLIAARIDNIARDGSVSEYALEEVQSKFGKYADSRVSAYAEKNDAEFYAEAMTAYFQGVDGPAGEIGKFVYDKTVEYANQNGIRLDSRFDASDDGDWITINGTHVMIDEEGNVSGGGKLNGMQFKEARSQKRENKGSLNTGNVSPSAEQTKIKARKFEKKDTVPQSTLSTYKKRVLPKTGNSNIEKAIRNMKHGDCIEIYVDGKNQMYDDGAYGMRMNDDYYVIYKTQSMEENLSQPMSLDSFIDYCKYTGGIRFGRNFDGTNEVEIKTLTKPEEMQEWESSHYYEGEGLSEAYSSDVQGYVDKMSGKEREYWTNCFSNTRYKFSQSSFEHTCFQTVGGAVNIARGHGSPETIIHETAHANDALLIRKTKTREYGYKEGSYQYQIDSASRNVEDICSNEEFDKKNSIYAEVASSFGYEKDSDGYYSGVDNIKSLDRVYDFIKDAREKYGYDKCAHIGCVTDILSGCTNGDINFDVYGSHSKSYWSNPQSVGGTIVGPVYVEAWADYCSLRVMGQTEMLELLGNTCPTIKRALDDTYREAFGV